MERVRGNMKNRHGYTVEVAPITEVEWYNEGGCAITRGEPGWGTFHLDSDEVSQYKPQVGDISVVYTQGFSMIRGVVIDGHVLRYTTPAQAEAEHEQWKKNLRLRRLEEYVANGDNLKARANSLHPTLASRMKRFDRDNGVEFWIQDAPYEMAVMEGAQALLDKVEELGLIANSHSEFDGSNEEAIRWIKDWWKINSADHNPPYDYKKQMELVPHFGEGHSGHTASAAYQFAVAILDGTYKEPL